MTRPAHPSVNDIDRPLPSNGHRWYADTPDVWRCVDCGVRTDPSAPAGPPCAA